MPKPSNLSAMNVDQLLKLRADVEQVLTRRATQLRDDLSKLSRQTVLRDGGGGSSLRGRKAPIKFRDRAGNTWAGRGAQPRWLSEKLKAGARLEDFAVNKSKKRRAKR
jgi:DNA-binding protein H-NS